MGSRFRAFNTCETSGVVMNYDDWKTSGPPDVVTCDECEGIGFIYVYPSETQIKCDWCDGEGVAFLVDMIEREGLISQNEERD